MKIKKFFALALVVTAFVLSANTVFSQDFKKSPEERAQKRAEKLQKELSLTDDQYKQVYDAFLSQSQQMKALKESTSDQDKTARREKMKSLWQSTDATVSGLLNSDQKTKYDQLKKERKEKHMQKKKNKKNKGSRKQK